jgi:hypothetical protein
MIGRGHRHNRKGPATHPGSTAVTRAGRCFLKMRGRDALMADLLNRVGAKPLHAFLHPAVGRIGQLAHEQAKRVLVLQQCRMARGSHRTQLHKKLIDITHGPGPRLLAREGAETLDHLLPARSS